MNCLKSLMRAAVISLAATLPAFAQSSPLTLAGMSVYRYDSLVDHSGNAGSYCCAPHILGGPDGNFVYIRAVFDVAWTEDLDRVSISSSDITLQLPGAEEGERAQGRYDWFGVYHTSAGSVSERRPRDWPNETAQVFVNSVWYVPRDAMSAELHLGEDEERLTVPVNMAVAVTAPISPGQTMTVTPRSLTRAAPLTGTSRGSGVDVPGQMAPRIGTMLEAQFDITPNYSTDTDAQIGENRAFVRASWFSLVGPDGMPLLPLGTQSSSNNAPQLEWTTSLSWDETPGSDDQTLYFLGAGLPGTYQLYMMEDQVAQFTLQ